MSSGFLISTNTEAKSVGGDLLDSGIHIGLGVEEKLRLVGDGGL